MFVDAIFRKRIMVFFHILLFLNMPKCKSNREVPNLAINMFALYFYCPVGI